MASKSASRRPAAVWSHLMEVKVPDISDVFSMFIPFYSHVLVNDGQCKHIHVGYFGFTSSSLYNML